MVKKLALLFVLAGVSVTLAPGQTESVRPYLEGSIKHLRERALLRAKVDWPVAEAEAFRLAKDADSVEKLAPSLKYLLSLLEDSHGRFFYKGQTIAYWFGEPTPAQQRIDRDIWKTIQNRQYPLKSEMIKKKIGYVRVPGLPTGDNNKMSRDIRGAVCDLARRGAERWIVDLRFNGGGNMYPMMEGLSPLLGEGVIGGVTDAGGRQISTWTIKDGDFYYDDYQPVDLENDCKLSKPPKIAILISQYTSSSGEAVAVAFKQRPQTRFFGLQTSGLVTVTDWTPIGTDLVASVSIGYYADRKGKEYRDSLDPDEVFDFNPADDLATDKAMIAAIKWLK